MEALMNEFAGMNIEPGKDYRGSLDFGIYRFDYTITKRWTAFYFIKEKAFTEREKRMLINMGYNVRTFRAFRVA